jgi:hypothetical protein
VPDPLFRGTDRSPTVRVTGWSAYGITTNRGGVAKPRAESRDLILVPLLGVLVLFVVAPLATMILTTLVAGAAVVVLALRSP